MFYGWRVVLGGFVAQLFVIGFFTYAVSLLVGPVRQEFDVSLEQVMYSLTLATFAGLFLQPAAGMLVDRLNVRWLMTVGAALYGLGLLGVARSATISQYVVMFGFTMALAAALAGPLCSSAVISRWFTVSRGRALGIAAIGTSVGGVVVPALVAAWLPEHGWRGAVEFLGITVLVVMLPVVVITIRGKPADVGLQPEGDGTAATDGAPPHIEMGLKDILSSRSFWLLGLSLGLLFSAYTAILSNLTPYATNLGRSAEQASSLIMTVAIAGFIGKLVFGMAADRFSLKAALWTAQLLVALGFLLLALEPAFPMMVVASACLGLAAGGMLPVWGAMMAQGFGLASYGRAMGLMGPLITLCVMPGFPLVGRLFDMSGSYVSSLNLFIGLVVVAAILLLPLQLSPPTASPAD